MAGTSPAAYRCIARELLAGLLSCLIQTKARPVKARHPSHCLTEMRHPHH
jgi:hypothetical protein